MHDHNGGSKKFWEGHSISGTKHKTPFERYPTLDQTPPQQTQELSEEYAERRPSDAHELGLIPDMEQEAPK